MTLVWYINPDAGGQAAIAKTCSTDQYTITTQTLPQDANQQRVQLARRLEAHDTGIDLMSIDPPYTAELANGGLLAPIPADEQNTLKQQSFKGATDAATWNGQLVVYPFWSNTQVLWYRKSFVQKAGLDMSKPVTWDQIIKAASDNGGTVAVQANKYEGYVVWINALVSGAGGSLVTDASKGVDATVSINSPAGEDAAKVIEDLAHSSAAPPDLSIAQEGQAGSTFGAANGAFMVNWTYIWHNYDTTQPDVAKDIGYTMYPETVAGKTSRPPYGGIGIGVSSYSTHIDEANQAAACLVEPKQQATNGALTGNMPASPAGYQDPQIQKLFPPDLIKLFEDSVNAAAPRTVTPYWSDISGAIQSTWHPPADVTSSTPAASATFIHDVLTGKKLL
ncbi:MAG TPA: extracellular solute-binding protein [Nocardioides sp.]|nr:extracellular solute-binding protein [Nocardioides sp.]